MEHSSYLIQRLKRPYKVENKLTALANAFSFGGGLLRGGLTKEAYEAVSKVCRFDYMGSAEFEFGAVPEAFKKIANYNEELIGFSVPIDYQYKSWHDKDLKEGTKLVYIICKASDKDEIIKRIKNMAVGNPDRTKERICLDEAMAEHEYAKEIVGWLELDNGYMFFIDKQMYEGFMKLLEI